MHNSHFSWLKPIVAFVLFILIFLSLSRLGLALWQSERIEGSADFVFIMLQGLRFDLVSLGILLVIPCTLLPLLSLSRWTRIPSLWFIRIYFLLLTSILVFLELATPNFIQQFDFRPNILFVEYLSHPKEVMTMLLKAVPMQLAIASIITMAVIYAMHRIMRTTTQQVKASVIWTAPILAVLMLLVCFIAGRSTLDHRPVNPSTVAFSSDPLLNSLPLNSTYTVAYAIYEHVRYESGSKNVYGDMSFEQALAEVRDSAGLETAAFYDEEIPTLHHQKSNSGSAQNKPKNLVIILEESLGADYVGSLGGLDVTPHLDALSTQGIWFDNLYATGTRSVRGIEAVITGFLPTPARSVVKLSRSQNNFFTIAQLLSRENYSTSFIYGGEAHFDNMRLFFANNGFDKIVDEKDYVNPIFYGSWGASDEDLFNKAHDEFNQQHDTGKPFFSLVFTSSNHSPFDFPDGRIELAEQPKATVANAVKYSDYALGEYIAKAKQSAYWENTVFLIIADHSDRVFGSELVPIKRFRIPGLILNADDNPRTISRLTSQIDMLPTLLSMIGVDVDHPALGIDLTRPDIDSIPGRAMMQFDTRQAYMEEDSVVILQKNRAPEHFIYRDKQLIETNESKPYLEKRALAHVVWAMHSYNNRSYRLPDAAE